MKNINFITSISPTEQREIRRWFHRSIFLCICTMLCICIVHLHQWLQLRELNKEYALMTHHKNNFDQIMTENNTLRQKQLQLTTRLARITKWHTQPLMATTYLQAITTMQNNKKLHLESLSVAGARLEISAQCPNEQDIFGCLQELATLERVKHIQLSSLRPAKMGTDAYLFKAHGVLNTDKA